jgi:peptide chain release factor subunit 1
LNKSSLEKHKLRKTLEQLRSYRGRHTELISIYIPDGYEINLVAQRVREEYSTAQNIKSKTTRKNVLGALERISQFLKLYRSTPKNGLIIFCGNVSEQEGVSDIQLFAINPPEPVTVSLYRCLQEFVVEPLEDALTEKDSFGLLVLDRREATIGLLNGKRIERVKKMTSGVPGKFRAGGQSARRFERLREAAAIEFFNRIGESSNLAFSQAEDLRGILVGGPSPTKDDFMKGPYLSNEIKGKVIDLFDVTYTDEDGLRELVNSASETLSDFAVMEEKKIVSAFLEQVAKDGLAAYGTNEIVRLLDAGAVQTLLISEGLDRSAVEFHCDACKGRFEKVVDDPESYLDGLTCPDCPSNGVVVDSVRDLDDRLIEKAELSNADVQIVSTDTEEGSQLLLAFGGLGAILRYRPG